MKLACIADIHSNVNYIEQLSKLDVDAILIAGDLTQFGTDYELEIILKKLNELNKDVIFIAGNHDMFAQTNKEDFEELAGHGYSVEEVMEVIAMSGMGVFYTHLANSTKIVVDSGFKKKIQASTAESAEA